MPAIGSLPMALSEIKTEFAGPNTMSSYLRGGTYVPNITANNAVATALPLTMSTFVGAVNRTFGLALGDQYIVGDFVVQAGIQIASNGSPWTLPTETGIGTGYEVQVARNSGDFFTSTPSGWSNTSWHALSTTRDWVLNNNVQGTSKSNNITITIRVAGGGATVASETLNLTAEVNP